MLTRCVSSNGKIAVKVIEATALVQQATSQHGCSPVAAVALGRALMGSLLMGAGKDTRESVRLELRGGGPLGLLCAETVVLPDGILGVRGYAESPDVGSDPSPNEDQGILVGKAVGIDGFLRVMRRHPTWKDPFTSTTALVTGEVGDDIARYLVDSEQVPSAVGLGVSVARRGGSGSDAGEGEEEGCVVTFAGGYLCSALPGYDDNDLAHLETNVLSLPPPSAWPSSLGAGGQREWAGGIADDVCARLLAGAQLGGLGRASVVAQTECALRCTCSRDSARQSVRALHAGDAEGRAALARAAAAQERLVVTCGWCGVGRSVEAAEAHAALQAEEENAAAP